MQLKKKPNKYEVSYSFKKDPNQWASFVSEEDKLLNTIMMVMSHQEWQLECVALIASSHPNKFPLPTP